MKKYKIYMMITGLVGLGACSESILDTELLTDKVVENYYATPAEDFEALVGCYDGLQLIWTDMAIPCVGEVMSDNCFGATGNGDGRGYQALDRFDKSQSPADVNLFGGLWKNYYKAIYRCNSLIQNIDKANWKGNESLKPIYLAEARYIRAFCYFDLARLFGAVPLILNTADATQNLPRTNVEEIYKAVAEDLKYASENGMNKSFSAMADEEKGRANRWAAKALLARVYLFYTGYYGKDDLVGVVTKAQALAGLEDVITNSGYSLVGMTDNDTKVDPKADYFDLWPAAATYKASINNISIAKNSYVGENNRETVFAVKYTFTSNYNGNTDGNHWMVMNGVRGQAFGKKGYGDGWGANTVLPDLYKAFPAGDKRKAASIIAIEDEKLSFSNQKDQREYTGFYLKKYTPTCDSAGNSIAVNYGGVNFMIGQFQDYVSIRYADVLLMAVELGSANAPTYWSSVLTRAGLDPANYPINKENIFKQRRFEFVGEGIRYWDMLRYDSNLDYAANAVTITTTVKSGNVDDVVVIDGAKLKATKGLQQLPSNEITLSGGVLTQNPGWE